MKLGIDVSVVRSQLVRKRSIDSVNTTFSQHPLERRVGHAICLAFLIDSDSVLLATRRMRSTVSRRESSYTWKWDNLALTYCPGICASKQVLMLFKRMPHLLTISRSTLTANRRRLVSDMWCVYQKVSMCVVPTSSGNPDRMKQLWPLL